MSAAIGLLVLLSASSIGVSTGAITVPTNYPASLTSFEWQAITSPQYAGVSFVVTILAKDENGNSYPFNGTALVSTTRGDTFVNPNYVTFSNGVCAANVVVTLAESLALRCSKDAASGTSDVFEVLPGASNRLMVILPGEQLAPGHSGGRNGRPGDQSAGDTFSFQVYLTDEWFNQIDESDDSVYFGSSDRFGRLPAGGQLSNGTGSFSASLRTAGQHHIFTTPALGESLVTDTSSTVSVFAGPYEQMLLLAPGEALLPGDTTSSLLETPGKSGTPVPQYLRIPFALKVYPCDRCWNLTVGRGDTVYINSFFPFEVSPWRILLLDSAVFSDVRATTSAPNQCIWAADPANGVTSYWTWLNIRALGMALEVTAPDTIRSGETTHVLIRVLDANGDPIVAALVQYSVVKGSGTMIEPALLTDTIGYTTAHFVCTPSPASEQDSVRISSGSADTVIGIYVRHLSDSLLAFPNPFGNVPGSLGRTQIFYSLHRASTVRLTIYDPFGNKIWTRSYISGEPGAMLGDNTVYWDGTNNKEQRVASGVYLIQVLGRTGTVVDFKSLYRVGVVW
jgi:hypothetical protein